MPKIIDSDRYAMQLCEALGIDTSKGFASRIVIDVRAGEHVRVYVEMAGTDALLDLKLPTSEIEIVTNAA